jgi:hypothetical protein
MITIKHENMTFEIKPLYSTSSMKTGYKLIERNHKGEIYNFNNTIYTENGINQLMIQRTRFCGSQIPADKLI